MYECTTALAYGKARQAAKGIPSADTGPYAGYMYSWW